MYPQDNHTGYIPPIRPSGTNSLEARIKALEVSRGYEARAMQEIVAKIDRTQQQVNDLHSHAESLQRRAAVWVIGALLAACSSLLLIVVKIKAPWMLTP